MLECGKTQVRSNNSDIVRFTDCTYSDLLDKVVKRAREADFPRYHDPIEIASMRVTIRQWLIEFRRKIDELVDGFRLMWVRIPLPPQMESWQSGRLREI